MFLADEYEYNLVEAEAGRGAWPTVTRSEWEAEEDAMRWYTVMVQGHPVEGSTLSKSEAARWLVQANREEAFDGEAYIHESSEPLAW